MVISGNEYKNTSASFEPDDNEICLSCYAHPCLDDCELVTDETDIETATATGTVTAITPDITIRPINKSGEEPTDVEIEWTTAKFEDELFQSLANYTEGLDNDGDIVKVKPYYQQATRFDAKDSCLDSRQVWSRSTF